MVLEDGLKTVLATTVESMEIINGDILNCDSKYIAHQCNCVSINSAYLAKSIFEKFPWANIYSPREFCYSDVPGNVVIKGNGKDQRYVIGLMGQLYPGPPGKKYDSSKDRINYFYKSLQKLLNLNIDDIAFPYLIGCGAAKGDWNIYYKILENFSKHRKIKII